MYIDLTKNIYDKMRAHQFVMSVMGSFDQELLRAFIKMTERKLDALEANEGIKKRIFHFVVECAQNLCNSHAQDEKNRNNLFLVGKCGNDYVIYLGCVYNAEESAKIRQIVDFVNQLSAAEVRSTFYSALSSTDFGQQNHLLMSVLDLAKRSKNSVCYEIFPINATSNFFSFNTTIASA